MVNIFNGRRGGTFLVRPIQDMDNCWAVVHTAMNLPVSHLLTGCGAVGFSSCTVLHVICWLLYVLVRRMAYSLCVVLCCVVLCCVALRCVVLCCVLLCCVALRCVALCCVVLRCVASRRVASRRVASCRVVSRCVVSCRVVLCRVVSCCVVLCCTDLCSHSASLQH